jgi:hypothetical protein
VAEFTFLELHDRTRDLTGPERLEVFHHLPSELQTQAWTQLAEWTGDRSQRDFEVWCRDRV